ncbi:MAG: cell division protein ZapD [Gammaproteobacteria bacterium]|nr:MAG: cell division protein ZapD [Gammaproteobacteria bacterium]
MSEWITYEHPLNERIRVLMRLEFIFKQIDQLLQEDSKLNTRHILLAIGELIGIVERGDLKSEILKELDRHIATMINLQETPGVDVDALQLFLQNLQGLSAQIHSSQGQIAAELKNDEFLTGVIQRAGIPGGTCDFDMPGYHYWLEQSAEVRFQQIDVWLGKFKLIKSACSLILGLIRDSSLSKPQQAEAGMYQQSLDKDHPCQLVRISLPRDAGIYPETSGNKRHFTVRFMGEDPESGKNKQVVETVEFKITVCTI